MDFQVRFELKTDKGSNMVSVLPPPEELLFPEPVSRADFQRVLSVLGDMDKHDVCCQVSLQPMAFTKRFLPRILPPPLARLSTVHVFRVSTNPFMFPPRVVRSRQLSPTDIPRIPSRMLRAVNTAIVASDAAQEANQWWFSSLCLGGSMSDRVLIKVSADADSGKVAIDVYSDSTLLPSKLTGPIKKALEGQRRS